MGLMGDWSFVYDSGNIVKLDSVCRLSVISIML